MRIWLAAVSAIWTALAGPAVQAEDNPVLVELYTSQGCSSCPPADELLRDLATRGDVMPLALHVDYWDYLGWKDTMGSPAFTARQKNYAHVAGHGTIYTPQMIIGGNSNVIGHKPMAVAKAISDAQAQAIDVGLQVERTGELVTISADAVPGLPRNMVVELVRFIPVYEVAIKRGENAGRTIRYVNAVTDLNEVGRWNGRAQLSMRVRAAGDRGLAVILQEPGPGRVIAVARLN